MRLCIMLVCGFQILSAVVRTHVLLEVEELKIDEKSSSIVETS